MICGYCKLSADTHPVQQCPYIYKPVSHNGAVIGYEMRTK